MLAYLLDRVEVRAVMEGKKQVATEVTITVRARRAPSAVSAGAM